MGHYNCLLKLALIIEGTAEKEFIMPKIQLTTQTFALMNKKLFLKIAERLKQ